MELLHVLFKLTIMVTGLFLGVWNIVAVLGMHKKLKPGKGHKVIFLWLVPAASDFRDGGKWRESYLRSLTYSLGWGLVAFIYFGWVVNK